MRQVDLQFVAATAVLADVLRLVSAVGAHMVSPQATLALVLHATDLTLEEVIGTMDHLVLLQGSCSVTGTFAQIALVRSTVHVGNVGLHFLSVAETFLTEGTGVAYLLQDTIHLGLVLLQRGRDRFGRSLVRLFRVLADRRILRIAIRRDRWLLRSRYLQRVRLIGVRRWNLIRSTVGRFANFPLPPANHYYTDNPIPVWISLLYRDRFSSETR